MASNITPRPGPKVSEVFSDEWMAGVNAVAERITNRAQKEKLAMTTPTQPQKRIRINVSITTKGHRTWDCTVEMSDQWDFSQGRVGMNVTSEMALAESDRLVAELERRYPGGREA